MSAQPPAHSPHRTNRLATRIRIVYLAIPALVVAILLIVGREITLDVASDTSRRLSRQYSIEAAANFLASTNPHFVLMQQLSRSTMISRWLANEHDPELKAIAFNEIAGYAAFTPGHYMMFTLYDSLNAYNFDADLTVDTFVSWGHIGPENHYESQWFYNTRDAEAPFFLNIQRSRMVDDSIHMYMWSNSRMYYQGRFVGVVTVGSPFDYAFETVFGAFDANSRRGYIIDENGRVRVDSAMLLQVFEAGIPTKPPIPEIEDNPALGHLLDEHLILMVNGIFPPGQYQKNATPLPVGIYHYGSIAPIIGTNWSAVVLANDMVDFYGGGGRYTPLLIGAIAGMVLSMLIGNTLIHRLAFAPLLKLTQSTVEVSVAGVDTVLFGSDRKDEIGDLSRTISSFLRRVVESANKEHEAMSRQLQIYNESIEKERKLLKALEYRTMLLNTINTAAEILLIADESENLDALTKGLALVGRSLDVSRVQIWLPEEEIGDELCFKLYHSWGSEAGGQKKDSIGSVYPYSKGSGWLDSVLLGIRINGPTLELLSSIGTSFDDSDVKSVLIIPMFLDTSGTVGFISIHDCKRERMFSEDEVDMVESAGLMFASVFSKNKQMELAYTDALTGIRNRRYLLLYADQELQRCLYEDRNFSAIMIDIDHFKSINDRYGHSIGDAVLKILAARVSHVLKANTIFARFAGEEFIVALPDLDFESALRIAWRIQKTIQNSLFRIEGLEISVTASFGVASKTNGCRELLEIIHNADIALYKAKNAGRNTVVGFDAADDHSSGLGDA